jgi:hypothetical protein
MMELVDFAGIGTNDLTQFAMATDRMAGALAELLDLWQPAVLDLIAAAGSAGKAVDKPVGVCGEAARDPLLALVLVGLGISSLSMARPASPPCDLRCPATPLPNARPWPPPPATRRTPQVGGPRWKSSSTPMCCSCCNRLIRSPTLGQSIQKELEPSRSVDGRDWSAAGMPNAK